ncbi:MAG: hypothetical protein ACRYGG_02290 [Janthinobacterium lividum]
MDRILTTIIVVAILLVVAFIFWDIIQGIINKSLKTESKMQKSTIPSSAESASGNLKLDTMLLEDTSLAETWNNKLSSGSVAMEAVTDVKQSIPMNTPTLYKLLSETKSIDFSEINSKLFIGGLLMTDSKLEFGFSVRVLTCADKSVNIIINSNLKMTFASCKKLSMLITSPTTIKIVIDNKIEIPLSIKGFTHVAIDGDTVIKYKESKVVKESVLAASSN